MSTSRAGRPRALRRAWLGVSRALGGEPISERTSMLLLLVVVGAVAMCAGFDPRWVPPSALALPLVAGGLLVRPPLYRWVAVATLVALVIDWIVLGLDQIRPGVLVVLALFGLFGLRLSHFRALTGVQGLRGGTMLVDLRDRLQAHGVVPELPAGWHADVAIRSATRTSSFSGDFLVAAPRDGGGRLELALVDVSGKGVEAATRALLLSGALGGLIGEVPGEEFLACANRYLMRQDWAEGFATAMHVGVDLETGEYVVTSAGHPPAAQFDAGSGRWRLLQVSGSALGLEPSPTYRPERGRLQHGDALLLYTDGVVETPGRDLSVGIDRLLGEADRMVSSGFGAPARQLVERASPSQDDDRAVVVIHRR